MKTIFATAAAVIAATSFANATPMFATPGANPECFEQSTSGNFYYQNFNDGCNYKPVRLEGPVSLEDDVEEVEEVEEVTEE